MKRRFRIIANADFKNGDWRVKTDWMTIETSKDCIYSVFVLIFDDRQISINDSDESGIFRLKTYSTDV